MPAASDVTATGTYSQEKTSNDKKTYKVIIKGLTGGHSGMDIHLGRGNANKLMNRFLYGASKNVDLAIHYIDGGSLRNAIPRESVAVVLIPDSEQKAFDAYAEVFSETIKREYNSTDPDLKIMMEPTEPAHRVLNKTFQDKLLRSVYACPNGIYRMSPDIEDLVQTSNNLARVLVKDGKFTILCLTRSSVDSEKMDEAEAIASTFELIGAEVSLDGSYPGWMPIPTSTIVKLTSDLYREMYNEEPEVNACHAGLECGILGTNYPEMEMISFGPNIRGAHSPDEKAQISSVQKFWEFLLETLKRIP